MDVAAAIEDAAASPSPPRVILVDCLTMLVSNLLLGRDGGEEEHRLRTRRSAIEGD